VYTIEHLDSSARRTNLRGKAVGEILCSLAGPKQQPSLEVEHEADEPSQE
jgi:hypothetical protein